ncbi:PDZ domain-containing protein [Longimicrobium sp.]|jgi:membrane-associated protease RseP (regulator of RpoE activity)|uniref:PDZ domain-containing protein n=1 Tax=Longimicrobium sp. TaxID=2029185 RepID=UPI002F930EB4
MKYRNLILPLLAAALALPATARAQEDTTAQGRRPGMIGVVFDVKDGDDAVRILEVRPGSPAARAGVRQGDVVVRLNGQAATGRTFEVMPRRLQAGDTVRLRVRRDAGGEQDVVIVAAPRPGQVRMAGPTRERMRIIIDGDTSEVPFGAMLHQLDSLSEHLPLEAMALRIDSLHSRLLDIDTTVLRFHVDSLITILGDSLPVMMRRMPNIEIIGGEGMMPLREEVNVHSDTRFDGPDARPFLMELGRRSAAGAELAEMNEGLSRYFGNVREGALVIDVGSDTPAARAGLEAGDVIVRAGGQSVNDPEDVRRALMRAENGTTEVEVVRQGRRRTLNLQWEGSGVRTFRRELRPDGRRENVIIRRGAGE